MFLIEAFLIDHTECTKLHVRFVTTNGERNGGNEKAYCFNVHPSPPLLPLPRRRRFPFDTRCTSSAAESARGGGQHDWLIRKII